MHFWRRYEKYYGQRILLLTRSEAKALRHEWVCPQCGKSFTEAELRSLVTEREWNQQLEMRAKRERPRMSRSPLKKLLEKVREKAEVGPLLSERAKLKRVLVPGEFVRTRPTGWSLKPWNWSQKSRDQAVSGLITAQAATILYLCWNYWCSMIKI